MTPRQAVEEVLNQSGDTCAGTFIALLYDLGFEVVEIPPQEKITMPDLKKVTITELKSALNKIENAHSDLETISDPVFDEDDSDLIEILDALKSATDKINDLVGSDD